MRQVLLTAGILLSAAGAASAQAVVTVVPPVPPATVAPPAPIVAWAPGQHAVTVDLDLTSLKEHANWADQAFHLAQVAPSPAPFYVEAQPFRTGTQSENLYSQARGHIDRNQYDRALSPLERVIAAKAERADAATYWKAYTLYKLARRDEALLTVGQLQKDFPQSAWLRDARALEVEIKQSAGQSVATDATDDDVKLLALQGIMRTDPEAALPVIEKMLAGTGNVRLKERALFVVSQNRSDRARDIIANVARSNANPDLQQAAIRSLAQSNSPEGVATLASLYRADQSMETRRAIITALSGNRNNTTAINALVTIARAERNAELKMQIMRYLSNSRAPEAKQYMLEILSK